MSHALGEASVRERRELDRQGLKPGHGEPRKVTGQGPRARSSGWRAETCSYIVEHRAFSQILSVSPGMGEGEAAEGAREP